MAKIRKIEVQTPQIKKRKKVAAYARVSRDTERLLHSVSAQVSYYSQLIQNNPDWEYAGVYADTGISGTGIRERGEFQRLLTDCEAEKIDIVLTKSISRFARNTVDLLATVRHLKEIGVEVRFEKEHIHSFSGDGELMLSILASFAQEESRSISENCKWGIRKRFQSGEIGAANKHILGYQYDDEKQQYFIIPEEAVIVKRMFRLYVEGISLQSICDDLNGAGYRTINGKLFQEASLNVLLHNEIYAGDLKRQKCYMADPIRKNKVKNQGQLPQYYMKDCQEAIIDRETYARVQQEFECRTAMLNPTYCFTGKIICGQCGSPYTRKKSRVTNVKFCMEDEHQYRAWEYLHSLTRKDGSYGKVLSDALVAVLDSEETGQKLHDAGINSISEKKGAAFPVQELAEETARIVLQRLGDKNDVADAIYRTEKSDSEIEKAEQVRDEVSEDMLAFALGMDL